MRRSGKQKLSAPPYHPWPVRGPSQVPKVFIHGLVQAQQHTVMTVAMKLCDNTSHILTEEAEDHALSFLDTNSIRKENDSPKVTRYHNIPTLISTSVSN